MEQQIEQYTEEINHSRQRIAQFQEELKCAVRKKDTDLAVLIKEAIADEREEKERLIEVRLQLQAMMPGATAPQKLTLLEVVDTIVQPLVYGQVMPEVTTSSPERLVWRPDEVKPWEGIEDAAVNFRASLQDSEPVYDGYEPVKMPPKSKYAMVDIMDYNFFSMVNQLGGKNGLAAIKFNTLPTGHGLHNAHDRVWTCDGFIIGSAEAQQSGSRSTLDGYGLLDEYWADPMGSKAAKQLHQLCGHMHNDRLHYGVLYTDACFWFAHFRPRIGGNGTLFVSKGIPVTQKQPTVFAMLLCVGELARQHVAALPPMSQRQLGMLLPLPFIGSVVSSAVDEQQPCSSSDDRLRMGGVVGTGSTGTVHFGRLGELEVAVKLPHGVEDQKAASLRLQQELDIYQGPLLSLQGVHVPRVVASGSVASSSGGRLPFFATDFMKLSLPQLDLDLDEDIEDSVVRSLDQIHQCGVLHGDVQMEHVMFASDDLSRGPLRPMWVDFSHARAHASFREAAAEIATCKQMLRQLRLRGRPSMSFRGFSMASLVMRTSTPVF